uniref:2-amino-4-hydroxy-6- hydroxymethyldihydropteridine diphosphokinase n=1 Tax=uncultured Acinetobacter sp. TaxID=165433 RepID=UPI0026220359|nr:2-amino-4-hydroxy-6-hydroxymethyldihydropteridine diphosphokinase [uncultured Acinetobacter sp.]
MIASAQDIQTEVDHTEVVHTSYIGLGSNLGDRLAYLRFAIEALSKIGQVRVSRLYASPPMGPQDQPDYLNAVVELITTLSPLDLLDQLQAIEQDAGRVRKRHWGERTLDLDLLLYGQDQIHHPRLNVPHVGLMARDFVLLPLLDLVPHAMIGEVSLSDLACVQNPTAHAISDLPDQQVIQKAWFHDQLYKVAEK